MTARCYAFEEVFGEKVRALGERARPRDLYDVINLFRNGEFRAVAAVIRDVLRQKCAFKSILIPTFEALGGFREELFGEWGNMLGHQLPALPPVESFWDALPEFFAWLAGTSTPIAVSAYPLAAGDQVLRAPAGAIRRCTSPRGSRMADRDPHQFADRVLRRHKLFESASASGRPSTWASVSFQLRRMASAKAVRPRP
jgi:hypothetical protein